MLSSNVGIRTDSSVQLSPLIKTNPLKTSFNHYMLVKDGDCDTFSTRKRSNFFPMNCRIIDTNFNILKQTPYLDGLYFFDGQNFAERFYFPTFSAPSSPSSLLTVDGQHYYIPGGWDTFPLENICSYRSGNKIEFCKLDTGKTFATFDFTETKSPPYLLENGKLAVMFDKTNIKLLDLTNQKVLYQTKSIQNWDAGNGVFATPSAIFNYHTGETFDLSNLGLDIIFTHILIKKDYVEFYVDMNDYWYMFKNPRVVRFGYNGKIKETISMSFMPPESTYEIVQSKDNIVLVYLQITPRGIYKKELAAYNTITGQKLWGIECGHFGRDDKEVYLSQDSEPKVFFYGYTNILKLDLKTGKIEKNVSDWERFLENENIAFGNNAFWYTYRECTNLDCTDASLKKIDTKGNITSVESPFMMYRPTIDSYEGKIYLVSRNKNNKIYITFIDTAIIDPENDSIKKSVSCETDAYSNESEKISLDGKFLFVYNAINYNQKIFDLSNGKMVDLGDFKTSFSMSSRVAGDKIYVLANFAGKKNVLTVFDTNLVQISKTWGLGDAAKILFANDKYVIFGKSSPEGMVVSDCNGNWWDSSSSCVLLDGDFAVIRRMDNAYNYCRLNLETRQVEALDQKNVWSYPITTSLGNTFFGERNTYDRDLNWLQTDMYISRIFPSTDKIYAQPSYFFGSVVELKPAPYYTLKRVGSNSFTIRNSRGDELADSLSGYAYTFTTPNNTIDRPTKLEGAQRFENLKPGQLATLKFDLGQIDETAPVHLAVFSKGFYDKKNTNPEKNKYAYVGTYLSDENPMLIYIGSWITK